MEVGLKMNGGDAKASYANNSLFQNKVISMTNSIKEEAVHKMIHHSFPTTSYLGIADLGCSSGPNTLMAIRGIMDAIHKARSELGGHVSPITIQVFLNDLPGNDFNFVFKELPSFMEKLKAEIGDGAGEVFVHGTPGSFYGRLYQTQSLHFVHSSYSLHWLSQVPKEIGKNNRSNVLVANGSPPSVIEAYYRQFQTDFTTFLRSRSYEIVIGGCMVLTFLGRSDDTSIKPGSYVWEIFGITLNQMVLQGLIEEKAFQSFNIPLYTPSSSEIEVEVKKEGSFKINRLQVSELDWAAASPHTYNEDVVAESMACMLRAAAEPMLCHHFGQGLTDEVFKRYAKAIRDCMAKERCFFTNVTFSLTKII